MKKISPLARFGLVVCFAYLIMGVPPLFNAFFGSYTFGAVPPVDIGLFWAHVALFLAFMFQVAAGILFPAYPEQSYKIAMVCSIPLLPASLIFMYGMKKSMEKHTELAMQKN